jgi:hypothetical protein
MAKQRHDQQPDPGSSRNAMIVLVIGGLLVAALVVWALTRTVEPSTTATLDTPPLEAPPVTTQTSTFTPTAAGTQAPPPQIEGERSEVPRISVEDLRAKLNRNDVTVIDVRDNQAYQRGHIPGALNIPFASTESMLDLIPKGKPIVTYCT